MRAVRVSPKFEVTIPKDVRRSMGLKPGMRFRVRQYKDILIELIPIGRKESSWDIRRRKEGKKPEGGDSAVSEPRKRS
jgi:AbrB family looped-hinge helix DNA binding protein